MALGNSLLFFLWTGPGAVLGAVQSGPAPSLRPVPNVMPGQSNPIGSVVWRLGAEQIVAGTGDVNGDGKRDVVLGLVSSEPAIRTRGEARVWLGQSSGLAPSWAWSIYGEQARSNLGKAVSSAGDVNADNYDDVILGAPSFSGLESGEGRAYVYLGSAGGLEYRAVWTADGGQAGAGLGLSVAGAGDVNGDGFDDVLVGAPLHDAGSLDVGRVYLYLGSASGLAASPAWSAEGSQGGARFGSAVSSAGDVDGDGYDDVLVGAAGDDMGALDAGRAYLYLGSPAGLTSAPVWTVEGDQPGEGLGSALCAGDMNADGYADVVVAAPFRDGVGLHSGRARMYRGSALGLASNPEWTAEGQEGAEFGWSVAMGDLTGDGPDEIIVGAPGADSGVGRVLVFRGSTVGMLEGARWEGAGDRPGLRLGSSVASPGDIDGDGSGDLVVGSDPMRLHSQANDLVRVFYGDEMLIPEPDWAAVGAWFVESAGDVNGDGYGDALAADDGGVPGHYDGRAVVFTGSSTGLSTSAVWTFLNPWYLEYSLTPAASAGDVNGDGFDDVIVATPFYGDMIQGQALVFHGGSSGLSTQPDWVVTGGEEEFLGMAVSAAGDVNGDGYGDVVVASGYNPYGRVYLYLGAPTGLSAAPAWTYHGTTGWPDGLSSAGDVNGDGFDDVIVAIGDDQSHLFPGSVAGLSVASAWTMPGWAWGAGDVNADGFGDVMRSISLSNPEEYEGAALLHLGSASGLSTNAAWMVEGNRVRASFGRPGARAGDVNGDGYGDVILCSRFGLVPGGSAHLYLGSASGLSAHPMRTVSSSARGFAQTCSTAGDVDCDGFDDWMVGQARIRNPAAEPWAYLYLGRP
ncbi:MAG: hypothetical protein HOP15_12255 [Planctomycetes bacterium]|nr:hypothetical protein [Planctomycetota bacterium]